MGMQPHLLRGTVHPFIVTSLLFKHISAYFQACTMVMYADTVYGMQVIVVPAAACCSAIALQCTDMRGSFRLDTCCPETVSG